jgi:galactokinase
VPAARAPGRVTIIGDHTDYNSGLSLPMAIDLATTATFTARPGSFLIGIDSDQFPEPYEVPLRPGALAGHAGPAPRHALLAAGLIELAQPPAGGSLRVTSTVPVGAGLSSSAAFSVAVLLALGGPGGPGGPDTPADPIAMATMCLQADARAGANVGLLDPLAIMEARAGHATFIDFATLTTHQVPVPEHAAFLIVHSGATRDLGASGYADRRAECDLAASHIGRPLGLCDLGDLSALAEPVLRRRARHVVTECQRVRQVEQRLGRGDLASVGTLMTESHRSLTEDYRVSTPALNELVDRLGQTPGVYGARMSGGGFGGCVIALCQPDSTALDPDAHAPLRSWVVSPSRGAALLES